MTFKVNQGQGQGQEMTSVPFRDYFYMVSTPHGKSWYLSVVQITRWPLVMERREKSWNLGRPLSRPGKSHRKVMGNQYWKRMVTLKLTNMHSAEFVLFLTETNVTMNFEILNFKKKKVPSCLWTSGWLWTIWSKDFSYPFLYMHVISAIC